MRTKNGLGVNCHEKAAHELKSIFTASLRQIVKKSQLFICKKRNLTLLTNLILDFP